MIFSMFWEPLTVSPPTSKICLSLSSLALNKLLLSSTSLFFISAIRFFKKRISSLSISLLSSRYAKNGLTSRSACVAVYKVGGLYCNIWMLYCPEIELMLILWGESFCYCFTSKLGFNDFVLCELTKLLADSIAASIFNFNLAAYCADFSALPLTTITASHCCFISLS